MYLRSRIGYRTNKEAHLAMPSIIIALYIEKILTTYSDAERRNSYLARGCILVGVRCGCVRRELELY